MKRRTLLKSSLGVGAIGIAAGAGLLSPSSVFAAWPEAAFKAKSMGDALKGLLGSDALTNSDAISINAPPIAENGAEVGITISSTMPNVETMAILVEKNGAPLAASFGLQAHTQAFIRTRIKIGSTSNVHAVVKSGGKLFVAKREVKVTIGGCGG